MHELGLELGIDEKLKFYSVQVEEVQVAPSRVHRVDSEAP